MDYQASSGGASGGASGGGGGGGGRGCYNCKWNRLTPTLWWYLVHTIAWIERVPYITYCAIFFPLSHITCDHLLSI